MKSNRSCTLKYFVDTKLMKYHDEEVFGDSDVGLHHPVSHPPNQKQTCLICCKDHHGDGQLVIMEIRHLTPDMSGLYEAISLTVFPAQQ